jgi:serine/threonine-protein kinase
MANVYLAVVLGPAGFNKLLVVKALREDVLGTSDEFVHMFLDEARLSARLNHPNIVQTYEIGEAEGRYFIAMEYLEGQPMRVAQRKLGPIGLPLEEEIRIIADTARGLHYAHELKGLNGESLEVVHRDVSPQNVFLTYDGNVKLLDFGIAKALDAEHLTKVGVIKGKLDYIAPEQIRGETIDRRADIFSLGAMLWEAVTGQRFSGGSKVQDVTKLHRRLTGGEPKARELKPDLPDQLAYVIDRALAVDPSQRHPTAAALADDLEAFLEKMGMRPSAKTLAERLGAPFAGERAKIGWLIEEQVKLAMQNHRSDRGLPSIGRNDLSQSSSGVRAGGSGEGTDAGTPVRTQPGAVLPAALTSSGVTNTGFTVSEAANTPASQVAPPEARKSAASQPKLLALGAVLVAAVGLAFATGGDEPTPNPTPAAPTAATAPVPSAATGETTALQAAHTAAPHSTVQIHIFVAPPEAHAIMDGASLPKLPFNAELPRDGLTHYVEASAPGYASKRVMVPFDRDRDVSIVLDKLPAEPPSGPNRPRRREVAAPSPGTIASERPSSAQSEDIAPGGLIPSKRRVRTDIDTSDPYAN